MSDKKQETIAEIVKEMVEFGNHCAAFGGAYSPERWNNLCKRLIAAHKREVAELRERIEIAEVALEKIDNMCDGDMCKYFEKTHHCSACSYLDGCQTGVAHAALHEIRGKGANNGK